jgi:glyoxylase-like metal-dependent hydrolase (beta-lactamase superfamily II)
MRPVTERGFALARSLAIPCLLLAVDACSSVPGRSAAVTTRLPAYEVYAVRYGTLPAFRVSGLVAGADTNRRLDIAMMVWVIRDPGGRVVLLDAGFKRPDLMARWKPTSYRLPSEAIGALGLKADDVTDVIVSHVHWDHFDGADLFPKARIWIQRGEVQHHLDSAGKSIDRTLDPPDAAMLHALRQAGRVHEIDGDAREILPGITVYTGGKHTFASQFVGVKTRESTIVLASDNMYLYENLDRHRPIAQTLDSVSNLAAQDRMRTLASEPRLIVPGHDPAVFDRFPRVAEGVVRIR